MDIAAVFFFFFTFFLSFRPFFFLSHFFPLISSRTSSTPSFANITACIRRFFLHIRELGCYASFFLFHHAKKKEKKGGNRESRCCRYYVYVLTYYYTVAKNPVNDRISNGDAYKARKRRRDEEITNFYTAYRSLVRGRRGRSKEIEGFL